VWQSYTTAPQKTPFYGIAFALIGQMQSPAREARAVEFQGCDVIRLIRRDARLKYGNVEMNTTSPPICDYEDSDYQESFWERGGRSYEDLVEAVALRRLLPAKGELLVEVGAGAGRNTPRYQGFKQVVLVDYSLSQLQQAQARLGQGERYIYVAADVYRLPFGTGIFDAATMIRVLHHMADPKLALEQIRRTLRMGAVFILEFANKQNLKAILRYALRKQSWNPFSREAVEFAALNYDFHPQSVRGWLKDSGFELERQLTVSHFRIGLLKRLAPVRLLVWLDSLAQFSGDWWQLTPSVFTRSRAVGEHPPKPSASLFKCPACDTDLLEPAAGHLVCSNCKKKWPIRDGIYDFREVV
jgi:ubiquinone/menaquinone biosynthesis C-methylase UbiE